MSKKVSGWPLIVPKEVDTEVTGDQIIDALAADVEVSDSGKVLTATYSGLEGEETGSVMWASPLPIIGEGDAGKVLTVNAGETGTEWAAAGGAEIVELYLGSINSSQEYRPAGLTHAVFYNLIYDAVHNKKIISLHPGVTEDGQYNYYAYLSNYLDYYSSNCIFGLQATSVGTSIILSWIETKAQFSVPAGQQIFYQKSVTIPLS